MKQKSDEYDLVNGRFQESLNNKAAQITEQTEIEKLVKQLHLKRVEIDIQTAEAIQLIQTVNGKHYEELGKSLHAFLSYTDNLDIEQYKSTQFSTLNEEISGPDSRQSIIQLLTISEKTQTGHKNVHDSHGQ